MASLVRSAGGGAEGAGLAPYCAAYEMASVNDPVQALRMIARLPTPHTVIDGLLLFAAARRGSMRGTLARRRST